MTFNFTFSRLFSKNRHLGIESFIVLFFATKVSSVISVEGGKALVCYTAVFSVVTQRSSSGEERCVTTLKTAVQQTSKALS